MRTCSLDRQYTMHLVCREGKKTEIAFLRDSQYHELLELEWRSLYFYREGNSASRRLMAWALKEVFENEDLLEPH